MAVYWKNRETNHILSQIVKDEEYFKIIDNHYKISIQSIEQQIRAFYQKYADKEGITISEAKKRVSQFDVESFTDKAKKYVEDFDFSKQANKELYLYNLTMKVNRLELLKSDIALELIKSTNDIDKYLYQVLTKTTREELMRQSGILGSIDYKNIDKKIKRIVESNFHNATFSERIWADMDALKNLIDKALTNAFIQGKNPTTLILEIRKVFDVTRNEAKRLLVTETARVSAESQKEAYIIAGYDTYIYMAEPGACPICKSLNNKVFLVENMEIGKNMFPMHPYCKCSTAAKHD